MKQVTVNYNVDDYGVLRIYNNETKGLMVELPDCGNSTEEELEILVDELLHEMGYVR